MTITIEHVDPLAAAARLHPAWQEIAPGRYRLLRISWWLVPAVLTEAGMTFMHHHIVADPMRKVIPS